MASIGFPHAWPRNQWATTVAAQDLPLASSPARVKQTAEAVENEALLRHFRENPERLAEVLGFFLAASRLNKF